MRGWWFAWGGEQHLCAGEHWSMEKRVVPSRRVDPQVRFSESLSVQGPRKNWFCSCESAGGIGVCYGCAELWMKFCVCIGSAWGFLWQIVDQKWLLLVSVRCSWAFGSNAECGRWRVVRQSIWMWWGVRWIDGVMRFFGECGMLLCIGSLF